MKFVRNEINRLDGGEGAKCGRGSKQSETTVCTNVNKWPMVVE